ncbi:MAG: TonB-dependent receptor plug domain-containing protein [Ignavibacteria bacterium]|nr:TonB-dependent receptor plug domain-containing protein [Ignavibacteria bacterium]
MVRSKYLLSENTWIIVFSLLLLTFFYSVSYGQVSKKAAAKVDSLRKQNSIIPDSTKAILAKSTIKAITPASLLSLAFKQNVIDKNTLESVDYRFTEDYLMGASGTFIKKLGAGGMPTEVSLFGLSATSTAFLNDGINFTNRLTNFTDLHLFQSESIDSIEVIPLSRGFLLGNNNISAVNIISREPSSSKPYSRLRYYQAPSGEGLIDGIFNITPFKKLNTYIELTNHGSDSYYTNSQFSNWMGNIRLTYLLSPRETIRINYKHVKSTVGLNGGMDLVATSNRFPNFALDDLIYNNLSAVVRFPNRSISNTNNFFSATLLAKLIEHSPSEFTFYYKDDLSEFRQNISGTVSENVIPVSRDNKVQTLGVRFRQDYSTEIFDIVSLTTFERNKYIAELFQREFTNSSLSTSFITTLKLTDNTILPSVFVKYLINDSDRNSFGLGGDVAINFTNQFSAYAGFSHFEKPFSQLEKLFHTGGFYHLGGGLSNRSQQIQTAELKASADFGWLKFSAGYFLTKNNNELVSAFADSSNKLNDEAHFVNTVQATTQGLSLQAQLSFWKIHFNTNSTLYLSDDERIRNGLPKFSSNGGVYYIDTLFNRNLKLKTGFNYYSYGSRYEQHFDFEKGISSSFWYNTSNGIYSQIGLTEFTPSMQIDFFLAGRIQDNAIIYFTWENLLDSKFSIVPFYPVQPRGLRFGVSWEFLD